MSVPYCVCNGDWPITFHKDCCHMVKVISCSVSLDRFLLKIAASHRMHEITAGTIFCLCFELVQIGVVVVVDPVEESQTKIPAAILLLMSRFGDSFLCGHFCAICAIQEVCFYVSLIILICYIERDGCGEVSIEIIWLFYK